MKDITKKVLEMKYKTISNSFKKTNIEFYSYDGNLIGYESCNKLTVYTTACYIMKYELAHIYKNRKFSEMGIDAGGRMFFCFTV